MTETIDAEALMGTGVPEDVRQAFAKLIKESLQYAKWAVRLDGFVYPVAIRLDPDPEAEQPITLIGFRAAEGQEESPEGAAKGAASALVKLAAEDTRAPASATGA